MITRIEDVLEKNTTYKKEEKTCDPFLFLEKKYVFKFKRKKKIWNLRGNVKVTPKRFHILLEHKCILKCLNLVSAPVKILASFWICFNKNIVDWEWNKWVPQEIVVFCEELPIHRACFYLETTRNKNNVILWCYKKNQDAASTNH